MKNLTWQNPEQLFVAQELINKVKSKCCGIKDVKANAEKILLLLVRLKEIGYLCVTYSDKLTSDIDKRQEHVFIPATRQWVIDRIHSRT